MINRIKFLLEIVEQCKLDITEQFTYQKQFKIYVIKVLRGLKKCFGLLPIYKVPPIVNIICSFVLIF